METIAGHLYDFPKYYDLIFGSDWKAEYKFLIAVFERFAKRKVKRLFEPGCGTGRLLVKFGKDGYDVAGLDLNEKAVAFCNARFRRHGLKEAAYVGDMADFHLKKPADACFNMINTFRHLPTEAAAKQHFRCIADNLGKGGLYVLGLHLIPDTPQMCVEEKWSATRGSLTVNSRLWSIGIDLKQREERIGMTYDVYTPSKQFRIQDETMFRTYTAAQMQKLFDAAPELELVNTFDFRYDLDWPIEINGNTEDVVYVLRKR
ncbi:MAG: class I SAM-dependent methyltransferase [Planctomycetaceae bacterium]|nr:class I SAM-dependent methyltransferase [Planctomycetaceae bacterium]